MTDSTILEFMSKHCKQDKRHDCAGMIGLDFEVVVCVNVVVARANYLMVANMEVLKRIIERNKDDVKEFSRMAGNTNIKKCC
jgi:hypothetical protein